MTPNAVSGIGTERLRLLPLTLTELHYCTAGAGLPLVSEQLGIAMSPALFEGPVRLAIESKINRMVMVDASRHAWYTYWLIAAKGDLGIGLIGFKGEADSMGTVELGYGIQPAFRRKGYATEAVRGLAQWAFAEELLISAVRAETAVENLASQRVLANCGFELIERDETLLYWSLARPEGTG